MAKGGDVARNPGPRLRATPEPLDEAWDTGLNCNRIQQRQNARMNIGELSHLTGASPKAIRHYEALGLLGKVARQGRYRQFGARELMRVRLIRQSQQLGFRLAELGVMSTLDGPQDWPRLLRGLRERRLALEQEIAALQARLDVLRQIETDFADCDDTLSDSAVAAAPTALGPCPLAAAARAPSVPELRRKR